VTEAEFVALGAEVDQLGAAYEEAVAKRVAPGVCPDGHVNGTDQNFCGECGKPLPAAPTEAEVKAFEAKRDEFIAARQAYRLMGEQEGFRVGVLVEDNTEEGE
jgi:hypothetical protein